MTTQVLSLDVFSEKDLHLLLFNLNYCYLKTCFKFTGLNNLNKKVSNFRTLPSLMKYLQKSISLISDIGIIF